MASIVQYDETKNLILINTNAILPTGIHNLPAREHFVSIKEAFSHTIPERIELFANDRDKALIKSVIDQHPTAKITEFTTL